MAPVFTISLGLAPYTLVVSTSVSVGYSYILMYLNNIIDEYLTYTLLNLIFLFCFSFYFALSNLMHLIMKKYDVSNVGLIFVALLITAYYWSPYVSDMIYS